MRLGRGLPLRGWQWSISTQHAGHPGPSGRWPVEADPQVRRGSRKLRRSAELPANDLQCLRRKCLLRSAQAWRQHLGGPDGLALAASSVLRATCPGQPSAAANATTHRRGRAFQIAQPSTWRENGQFAAGLDDPRSDRVCSVPAAAPQPRLAPRRPTQPRRAAPTAGPSIVAGHGPAGRTCPATRGPRRIRSAYDPKGGREQPRADRGLGQSLTGAWP